MLNIVLGLMTFFVVWVLWGFFAHASKSQAKNTMTRSGLTGRYWLMSGLATTSRRSGLSFAVDRILATIPSGDVLVVVARTEVLRRTYVSKGFTRIPGSEWVLSRTIR